MNTKNRFFLFDLDGTLSKARQKVQPKIAKLLRVLSSMGTIVIVSGSDYNFINEQMSEAWHYMECEGIILLPCNGTKRYDWKKRGWNSSFVLSESLTMREHVGAETFSTVVTFLTEQQLLFMKNSNIVTSCSGNFITYRGSMLNWSPIGRNGNPEDRDQFVRYDQETNFRTNTLEKLKKFMDENEDQVQASLGGDTSFDIFPIGWDKTVSLRFFDDTDSLYFFGDRCYPGGNDFEIFEHINKTGEAYSVNGPEETSERIKELIRRLK